MTAAALVVVGAVVVVVGGCNSSGSSSSSSITPTCPHPLRAYAKSTIHDLSLKKGKQIWQASAEPFALQTQHRQWCEQVLELFLNQIEGDGWRHPWSKWQLTIEMMKCLAIDLWCEKFAATWSCESCGWMLLSKPNCCNHEGNVSMSNIARPSSQKAHKSKTFTPQTPQAPSNSHHSSRRGATPGLNKVPKYQH